MDGKGGCDCYDNTASGIKRITVHKYCLFVPDMAV
jgi:hypothetical protein